MEIFDNLYNLFSWLYYDLDNAIVDFYPATGQYGGSPSEYPLIGIITILIPFVLMAIYYFIIDHPRFCKTGHWGLWYAICILSTFLFGLIYTICEFPGHGIEHFNFGLANLVFGGVWALAATAMFKIFSNNTRNTPWKSPLHRFNNHKEND